MTNTMTAKEIRNAARREAADSVRREVAAYKVAQGCAVCGDEWRGFWTKCLALVGIHEVTVLLLSLFLDLDHINPAEKRWNVADAFGRFARAAIFAEVAKCRVLCKGCHAAHTFTIQRANR